MYLCVFLPILPGGSICGTWCTFLRYFGLPGEIMALLETSGLMHPYLSLTLHGLLWHILLIFMGCFASFSVLCRGTSYRPVFPLLFFFCILATGINIFAAGQTNMFYLSPHCPMNQAALGSIPHDKRMNE